MATRIQSLFLVRAAFAVSAGEDWSDAIAFFEADGVTPISLDGIVFRSDVRQSRESSAIFLSMSSAGASPVLPASTRRGLMLSGGPGGNALGFYAPFSQLKAPIPGVFVGDVLAVADGITKRVVEYDLTITRAITR